MSKLTFVDQKNLPEPRKGVPLPERRVEGDPRFLTWDIAQTADGQVQAGVWEVTPGAYRSVKGETFEFCYILSGFRNSLRMDSSHVESQQAMPSSCTRDSRGSGV